MPFHRECRRAAAKKAETKIKQDLEKIENWRELEDELPTDDSFMENDESFQLEYSSDSSETRGIVDSAKKPTHKACPDKKHFGLAESHTSEASSTPCSDDEEEIAELMAEIKRRRIKIFLRNEHRRRCAARMVHSNGPMLLSRRMSFKMTQNNVTYSPIAACKLSFEDRDIAILNINRNMRKRILDAKPSSIFAG